MTITKTPEFNSLLAQLGAEADGGDYAGAAKRLTGFIDAYVVTQRRLAVDQFKSYCTRVGIQAVQSAGFEQLVSDLDRLPDGDLAAHARSIASDALTIDAVEDGPEFTIKEDADLDRLLNSTACLLSGRANQDVGLAWYDDLQTVLKRLSATESAPDVGDAQLVMIVRYRVHMVVDNVLGRVIYLHFKSGTTRLVEILGSHDVAGAVQLFQAFEKEFNLELSVEDRRALLEMGSQQVAEYFNRRISEEKGK
jgi:hypothetical protein